MGAIVGRDKPNHTAILIPEIWVSSLEDFVWLLLEAIDKLLFNLISYTSARYFWSCCYEPHIGSYRTNAR